jgi:hypothetical protein
MKLKVFPKQNYSLKMTLKELPKQNFSLKMKSKVLPKQNFGLLVLVVCVLNDGSADAPRVSTTNDPPR